jgi:hypothetical protein
LKVLTSVQLLREAMQNVIGLGASGGRPGRGSRSCRAAPAEATAGKVHSGLGSLATL